LIGSDLFSATDNTNSTTTEIIQSKNGRRVFYFDGTKWHVLLRDQTPLQVRATTLSANTTLTSDDAYVPVSGGGTFAVTFPANPKLGQFVMIKEAAGNNAGTITLTANTGQKINTGTVLSAAGGSFAWSSVSNPAMANYSKLGFVFDANSQWMQVI
jgi:hypothetical protein